MAIEKIESDEKFPELSVRTGSGRTLELCCKMPEKFFCGEFTLRDDVPVPLLISPWMQFEPSELADFRQKWAFEIMRRAMMHESLVQQIKDLQLYRKREQWASDREYETQQMTYQMWRKERAQYGLAEDFSDIKEWPPEMMNGYNHPPRDLC